MPPSLKKEIFSHKLPPSLPPSPFLSLQLSVLCPPVLLLSFPIDRSHNLLQQRGCLRSLVLSYETAHEEGKEGGGEGGCGGRGEGLSKKMVGRDRGSLSLPSFRRAVLKKNGGQG